MEICRLPVESVYYSEVLDGYHYTWSFHDFFGSFRANSKSDTTFRTPRNLQQVFQSTFTFTTQRFIKNVKKLYHDPLFTQNLFTWLNEFTTTLRLTPTQGSLSYTGFWNN